MLQIVIGILVVLAVAAVAAQLRKPGREKALVAAMGASKTVGWIFFGLIALALFFSIVLGIKNT